MEEAGFKRKILLFVEWLTYKCATKVYPNSFGLKKFILENISIPKYKIKVIGSGSSNGIDTYYFNRTKDVKKDANFLKKKFGLNKMFTFIFIGRIVKDKGIEVVIYEPTCNETHYLQTKIIKSLDDFKSQSDLIVTNRMNKDLLDVEEKVFTRDLFGSD